MKECFREKFIYNDEIMTYEDFESAIPKEDKSLYEVIRIIEGVPLFLEDHLERLENSSKIVSLELFRKKEDIVRDIHKLCKINNVYLGNVKLIFNYNNNEENFLAYFVKHSYPTKEMYKDGVTTALYNAERENPNAKIVNSKLRKKTSEFIKEKGVFEAILVDNKGYITEGSKSSIFAFKDNEVYTSPLKDVLPGITRKYIFKVCDDLNLNVNEVKIHSNEINNMDGFFICGTSPKVLPINKVDTVSYDVDNELIQKVKDGYENLIDKYIKSHKNS